MKRVLFVDDDPNVTAALIRSQRKEPYEVRGANGADEALNLLAREPFDIVISDEQMPGMLGSEFLSIVAKKHPETVRIILTGHANIESAIRAINGGEIYRFLTKPCHEAELAQTIRQAIEHKDLVEMSQRLLRENKQQSEILAGLEKQYPGITQIKKSRNGSLILDEEQSGE
jgi:DNA-binding NtrC family response regulator